MVLTSALVFFYFRDYMNAILDWGSHSHKTKMSRSQVEKCLELLFKQQEEIEKSPFGRGKVGVLEALAVHFSKVKEVAKLKGEIDVLSTSEAPDENALDEFSGVYDTVKALCDRKSSSLQVVNQIASLEDHVQNLSSEFDARSVYLVSTSDVTKTQVEPNQPNESLARTAQDCIQSVRENWKWIFQLVQCTEVHLRNAAAYQEFFQEAETAEHWMNSTLSQIHPTFDRSVVVAKGFDGEAILKEIKSILAAYLKWQTKIDYLLDKAKQVVPVRLRVKPLSSPRPVIALTDYKTEEIEFIEGDTLTLLDNSDRKKWKVQNETGQTGFVPAVIILITAPATEAIDMAIKLRLQLLNLWTSSVKYLGYKLITLMILVFQDWTDEQVPLLQGMTITNIQEVLRILKFIEDTLTKNWSEYVDYDVLCRRIIRFRMFLEGGLLGKNEGNSFSDAVVVQVKTLEAALTSYQEFWAFWEVFKCVAEMLRQPRFLLVCDKWEQLRFVTSAQFVKFWDTQLDLARTNTTITEVCETTSELPAITDGSGGTDVATISEVSSNTEGTASSEVLGSTEGTITEEKQETTTDTVTSTLEEEQHTFVIKSVLDPRDDSTQLTLEQAIKLGIVDDSQKHYKNPRTGKVITIIDALNEGRLLVEFVSRKKIREEKNSYGILTITITTETSPYTITSVLDPATDEKLTVTQAVKNNILDASSTTYRTEKGEVIPIADAIHSGLVCVEYHAGESERAPEVVTKTYLVHGVVDQKKKQKVSFADAVQDGLLDRDTGEYVNNVTNEHVPVHEAIMKGYIKARIASDPSKLEINPENTIVVEKLSSAKAKLLKSVQAAKAFKA